MNWLYLFSTTEIIFIGLFIGLYLFYIWRTFQLARQLNTSAWGVIPKFFLRGSYLTLLIMALLGPSFGEAEGDLATVSHDTFLIVDMSRSMDATDIVPTRLERVKYDIQQLCDTLPAERFGLIVASTESFVLSPLTTDQDAIKQFIREVRSSVSPGGGTDLCSAIDLARQKFLTDSSTQRNAKAIVLFSDGENFSSCETNSLTQLRLAGVPLITVGVGTEAGVSIREGRDFVRDNDRQIVRSRLNRSFLQEMARNGRGQYIEADNQGRYVNELAGIIRSLKGRGFARHHMAVSTNKYYYFLIGALVLIAFDLIITIRTFRL